MQDEKKEKIRYLIITILIIIAMIIMELFICKTALALEVKHPNSQVTFNNTTYYGFNLPTRPTKMENDGNKVHLTSAYCTSIDNCSVLYSNSLLYGLRELDDYVLSYISDIPLLNIEDMNIPDVWTGTLDLTDFNSMAGGTSYIKNRITFGIQPGGIANNNLSDMLSDGYAINYDSYYSYTFDVIMYNQDGYLHLNNNYGMSNDFYECGYNFNNDYTCSRIGYVPNVSNNTIIVNKLIDQPELQYFRITVPFNMYQQFGFNQSAVSDPNVLMGVEGNNLLSFYNDIYTLGTKVIISEPYNITLWTTDSSIACTDTCWTQADTNANQRIIGDVADNTWDLLNNIVLDFDYHGFTGIVNLTYNYIIEILQDSQENTCNVLNIPVLSTSFDLPSACSFWNREDVATFESFYHVFWLGLISFFICWRVFRDIVNIYDPDSKIIDGNEVNDL